MCGHCLLTIYLAICGMCWHHVPLKIMLHNSHQRNVCKYVVHLLHDRLQPQQADGAAMCRLQEHVGFLKMFLSLFRVLATNGKHGLMMNVFGNPTLLVPMLTTFK